MAEQLISLRFALALCLAINQGAEANLTANAGRDITLSAARDIQLEAAANTSSSEGSNQSSGASVGVSVGTSGITPFVNIHGGKGGSNGHDKTWTESRFSAGDTLLLDSGRDTTLKGAVISGDTVVADIGRNLTLQSLQDTSTYNSQQTNFNAGLEIGAGGKLGGNAGGSQTSINSNYRSVIEQTAINAGSGGFDITVGGNTHLKGAIINSTANPEDNLLTTGTLTVSDIKNSGQYEASRVNAGLNISGSLNTGADKPAGGSKGGSKHQKGSASINFLSQTKCLVAHASN